jgi:hypothetical protein
MMELTPEMIIGGATAMGGAIVWLARNQIVSQRRCERSDTECRAKQAALDEFIRTTLLRLVESAANREASTATELTRARHVIERAEKRLPATDDQTPLQTARTHC